MRITGVFSSNLIVKRMVSFLGSGDSVGIPRVFRWLLVQDRVEALLVRNVVYAVQLLTRVQVRECAWNFGEGHVNVLLCLKFLKPMLGIVLRICLRKVLKN